MVRDLPTPRFPENDVTLRDLARLLRCLLYRRNKVRSVLRRGGRNPGSSADFSLFTIVKQHGCTFREGPHSGIQFDTLFTDDLYLHIGESALTRAAAIKLALKGKRLPVLPRDSDKPDLYYSGERSSAPPGGAGGIQLLGEI